MLFRRTFIDHFLPRCPPLATLQIRKWGAKWLGAAPEPARADPYSDLEITERGGVDVKSKGLGTAALSS